MLDTVNATRDCHAGGGHGSQRHRTYFPHRLEFRTLPRFLSQAAAVPRAEAGHRYRDDVLLRRRPHRGRHQRAVSRARRRDVRAKARRPASSVLPRARARRHRRTARLPPRRSVQTSSARRARINGRRDITRSCSKTPTASGSNSITCRGRGCWGSAVGWVERSETHHATRASIDGFRCALPILQRSFRLAEIVAQIRARRALPLMMPCGMIAPNIKAADNAAANSGRIS